MSGFALHPEADADLDEIRGRLAEYSLESADRVIGEIYQRLRTLASFPHQGYRRPDMTSRPVRFVLVREYVIAYAPNKSPLWIIAVFHGRRDPRVIAAILREREQ